MKRLINKYGAKILAISLGAAAALSLMFIISGRNASIGEYARITVYGTETETFNLSSDIAAYDIVTKNGLNVLEIQNGAARIIYADCPDKLCVKQGRASDTGRRIVCLPHGVVVEILGGSQKIDAVTR